MGVVIGNEEVKEPKKRQSHPKPTIEVKVHSGLFGKNLKVESNVCSWHTAVCKAILELYRRDKKRCPRKIVLSIKKGKI